MQVEEMYRLILGIEAPWRIATSATRTTGDEHRKGSHCEELARIEKGATVTQPTFSLWRGYSKAKGGAKDVDGARLRTHSQKTL